MQALIDELHEAWINGNRKYAIEMITTFTHAKACLAGALLATAMHTEDRMILFTMLRNKIDEQ